MMRKVFLNLILLIILFNLPPIYRDTYSQPKTILRVIKKNDDFFIRVLTPLNIKEIKVEILSVQGANKAIIHREYFAIREYFGKKYNEFVISSKKNNIADSDVIKVTANMKVVDEKQISEIPYDIIKIKDDKETSQIRVMTYNIHRGRNKIGNSNIKDIEDFVRHYNPDIVGFQEVDKNVLRTNFEDQLKLIADNLSMYYYFGSNKSFLKGEYGNGILSKYPIENPENIIMQGGEPRGLLKTTISINKDKKMTVMVTHLGLDNEDRQKQFNTILDYISIYEDNLILIGDFNVTDLDRNIIRIQHQFNDPGSKIMYRHMNTLNTFKNKSRVDYVFTNKSMRVKEYKVEKVEYSDHFPVIVDIEY